MAASAQDAHPYPIYNARFRLTVPLLDADGDPISPSSPDTELSQDSGTFADATNEFTELATSSGVGYVDLTATELDTTITAVKIASTGAKTTIAVLNPRRLPIIRTGTAQAGAATTITLDSSASAIDDYYVGCYVNITNDTPTNARGQARVVTDYVGSTKVATVATWGTNPSSSSTFEILATPDWIQRLSDVNAIAGVAVSTSTAQLGVNVVNVGGSAVSQSGGLLNANVTQISGDATASDNAESFFDGTGYAGANNVIPTVTNLTNLPAITSNWLTAAGIASGALNGKGDWNIGKSGYALSSAGVQAIWDALTSALTTVGSIGKLLVDNINATISSRLASASYTAPLDAAGVRAAVGLATANLDTQLGAIDGYINTDVAEIKAKTDQLTFSVANQVDANALGLTGVDPSTLINEVVYPYVALLARKDSAIATDFSAILGIINDDYGSGAGAYDNTTDSVEAIRDRGDAAWVTGSTPPTAAAIADAVWDETLADHLTAGSTGNALNAAGSAGDPWSTALPGAYGAGTAGKIIGDNINATVSSRASQTSLDTLDNFVDTEVAAILEDTGTTLPAQIAALSIPTAAQNADAVWDEATAGHTTIGTYGRFTPADVVSWDGDSTYIPALNLIMEMYQAESYVNANLKAIGDVDLVTGTAQTGSSSSIRLAAGESSVASVYVGYLVLITSGTGAKQLRYINGYNGTTKDASVTPAYATNPDNTSVYLLIPTGLAGADILAILSDENAAQNLQNVVAEYGNEGYLPANVTGWNSSPVATPDTAGYPVVTVKDGTGQGEISTTSGRVGVNLDDTAGTLAKGTDLTGFNDLDAAGIRTSVGLASANLDTQLTAIDDFLDTEIAAIKAKTDNLPTDPADQSAVEAAITAATSGLATAANLATLTAYVDTEVAAILEDTGTTIPAQIAALNNLSAAQVNTEVDTALTDIHLDHLLATDYDPANKPGVATALLNELIGSDAGVSQFTANALELAPAGGGGGGLTIADFFTDDSGLTYADAVAGSVVKEIADNAGLGGGAIEFTYTVINNATSNPLDGATVQISTDLAGSNIIWSGVTDAFGVARTLAGIKPFLDPGTYYFWVQKSGYAFTNPDTETVS
jgi:hypothetical protein